MSPAKKPTSKEKAPATPLDITPTLPNNSESSVQLSADSSSSVPSPPEDDNYLPFLSIKEDRPKYPSLQTRNLMYFRMSPKLTAKMIHLLEQTGWTQTDAGNLILNSFFLMNRSGVFQLLMDKKRLESDDINDLRANRDMLLNVSKDLENVLKISVWKIHRKEQNEDIADLHV
jgi:hypothetical protein